MEPVSLAVETLTLLVDIGILWILVEEFNYDKIQDEKKEYKRKKAYAKKTEKPDVQVPISNQTDMVPKLGAQGDNQSGYH